MATRKKFVAQARLTIASQLQQQIKLLQTALDQQLGQIRIDIENGWVVEPGELAVVFLPGRRNPKWKDVVIENLGEDFAEEIIRTTPPGSPMMKLVRQSEVL